MLWFTFKVTFGTIPAGWLAGWLGGKELIIRLAKSSWSWSWDLSLAKDTSTVLCALYDVFSVENITRIYHVKAQCWIGCISHDHGWQGINHSITQNQQKPSIKDAAVF